MKKSVMLLVCALFLTGCSARETFENVSDNQAVSANAIAAQVELELPEEAAAPSMEAGDGSKIYLCDGYTVTVHTLEGGDLGKTIREISGFSKDELTVMRTMKNGNVGYEFVWTAAGEGEDQTCRAIVLDDGAYHYAVTAMANYTQAGALAKTWQDIFNSVSLRTD